MKKREFIIVWIVLVLLTVVSAIISISEIGLKIEIILGLAILKFIGVTFYFMNLKKGHIFWKLSILLFLLMFSIIILVIL